MGNGWGPLQSDPSLDMLPGLEVRRGGMSAIGNLVNLSQQSTTLVASMHTMHTAMTVPCIRERMSCAMTSIAAGARARSQPRKVDHREDTPPSTYSRVLKYVCTLASMHNINTSTLKIPLLEQVGHRQEHSLLNVVRICAI